MSLASTRGVDNGLDAVSHVHRRLFELEDVEPDHISDLIADLLHLADSLPGIESMAVLDTALKHYMVECGEGDDLANDPALVNARPLDQDQ